MITKQIEFNPQTNQYLDNGRILSEDELSDIITDGETIPEEAIALLALGVFNNQISPDIWEDQLREEIKKQYIRNGILGAGGRNNFTQTDLDFIMLFLTGGVLNNTLDENGQLTSLPVLGQYQYLSRFKTDLNRYSEAQIRQFSRLYVNSARKAFEFIKSQKMGVPFILPAYPGDGSTVCKVNCHCHWEHLFENGVWVGSNWTLGIADHCPDCVRRSGEWKPFVPRL
jgi:hypothetical protein